MNVLSSYGLTPPMQEPAFDGALFAVVGIFYLVVIVLSILLYVKIAHKAGYSGWYVALLFVPIANLVVIVLFALKEWPIETRLRELEAKDRAAPPRGLYSND